MISKEVKTCHSDQISSVPSVGFTIESPGEHYAFRAFHALGLYTAAFMAACGKGKESELGLAPTLFLFPSSLLFLY
jgi:hypothetical protein